MTDIETIYFIVTLSFIVGACLGSFVTMASHRLPNDEDIVFKPSYCPRCQHKLTPRELVPLGSWLVQKGRCHQCQSAISARYPLIELVMGLVFTGIVLGYGVTPAALLLLALATILMILIVTDLEHFIIPDSLQVAIILTGILYRFVIGSNAEDVALTAALGLGLGLSLHYGYLWFRHKDALGWGDVKFLGAAGVWLTLPSLVPFLFFSGLIGIVTGLLWRVSGRGCGIFPFGPALAVSLYINVLWPDILQTLSRAGY